MIETNAPMQGQMGTSQHMPDEPIAWLGPVRMLIITMISFGYASTMPRGPQAHEYGNVFGFDPSWFGIQMVFMISGFLALRSLHRHGSALKLLLSRMGRNMPGLLIYALLVILVVYPLFATPLAGGESRFAQHISFVFKVVTCIDPGELTPGLLDNALYMCVLHGGLWTFRWGMLAFVSTAVLWRIGGLRDMRKLAVLALSTMMAYAALSVYNLSHSIAGLDTLLVVLRLAWVYILGMWVYGMRDLLPRSFLIPIVFVGLAALQFNLLAWTPFIEISAELGFGYLTFLAITANRPVPKYIKKIPDISLGLFLYNWPASQIVLLLIPSLTPWPLFALSFPVTLSLAFATWFLVSSKINFSVGKLALAQSA